MKIAILGKGTSAIITALTCIGRGHEVEIYFDPDKPHLTVGEATTPHIANLIKDVLDVSIGNLIDENIVSLKNGVEFCGWGVGNKFRHYFNSNSIAFHFESNIFNQFIHNILENMGVKYHAFRIEKYDVDLNKEKVIINDHSYDHFICCSGWDSTDEYKKPIFETVNSALLYSKKNCNGNPYTNHLATVNGWQFGLPFPEKNITKHGYLFNTKFTNVQEAKNELNVNDVRHISWEPKYCKKMIQNRFCSYNGNRLLFFEPLQSLSLFYYHVFADYICEFIEDKKHETYVLKNQHYLNDIFQYQLSLAWHYSYGAKNKTPFWDDVEKRSNYLMNTILYTNFDCFEDALFHDKKFASSEFFKIGSFTYSDYFQIHEGMTGKKLEFKDTYTNFF